MSKKVIAVLAAAVLAVVGIGALAVWAQQADDRAYEGAKLVEVVQVQTAVPKGTAAAELTSATKVVELPSSAVPKDAVKSLTNVAGRVTGVRLEPGEVLLGSRMIDPKAQPAEAGGVPRGLQEISISLDAQRLVSGQVEVGDKVGILASYDKVEYRTKMIANRVQVTHTDYGQKADEAPGQAVVTLAVTARQAELITNAGEFGKIWLTKQNDAAKTAPGQAVKPEEVVR